MKNYVVQQGDTFDSLSKKFKLKDEGILKTFHNLYCPIGDVMQEPIPGKTILIPEDPAFLEDGDAEQDYSSDSQQNADTDSINNGNPEDQERELNQSSQNISKEQKEENNPQNE